MVRLTEEGQQGRKQGWPKTSLHKWSASPALCLAGEVWGWLRNSSTPRIGGLDEANTCMRKSEAPVFPTLPHIRQWMLLVEAFSSWCPTPLLPSEDMETVGQTHREKLRERGKEREGEKERETNGWRRGRGRGRAGGGPLVNKGSFS